MCYYSHKLTYVTKLATGLPGNGRMTSQRFVLHNAVQCCYSLISYSELHGA
jgi:hypothetical protein